MSFKNVDFENLSQHLKTFKYDIYNTYNMKRPAEKQFFDTQEHDQSRHEVPNDLKLKNYKHMKIKRNDEQKKE